MKVFASILALVFVLSACTGTNQNKQPKINTSQETQKTQVQKPNQPPSSQTWEVIEAPINPNPNPQIWKGDMHDASGNTIPFPSPEEQTKIKKELSQTQEYK